MTCQYYGSVYLMRFWRVWMTRRDYDLTAILSFTFLLTHRTFIPRRSVIEQPFYVLSVSKG